MGPRRAKAEATKALACHWGETDEEHAGVLRGEVARLRRVLKMIERSHRCDKWREHGSDRQRIVDYRWLWSFIKIFYLSSETGEKVYCMPSIVPFIFPRVAWDHHITA